MPLSDAAVRNLKPLDRPFKRKDFDGLYLLVKPTGAKLWRYDYRFFGTRKTLALGQYPATPVVKAREERDKAKRVLAEGKDPGAARRIERVQAAAAAENTFERAADAYLALMVKKGRAQPTIDKNTWMLKDLASSLANRPLTEIRPFEIAEVIKRVQARGVTYSAIQMRSTISRVFQLAIASGQIEIDPTPTMKGVLPAHKTESFPGLTDPEEVGGLMRALAGYDGWPTLVGALKVQAYCFARPGETRQMEWTELDLDRRIWSIPPEKAKWRRPQDVPLSEQAIEVIEEMRPITGSERFVFRSMMSGKAVLSENSMNSALRRMGFRTKDQHCAHGFRTTASTLLNGSKRFDRDVIEAQMAHLDPNRVRRIYNRAEYWEHRVPMMQWYADLLDSLAQG